MMRGKIKFRAWDKNKKELMPVKILDIFHKKVGLGWNEYDGVRWIGFDDAIIMRCYGFKDKHGNDVYEGDIVYTIFEGEPVIAVVEVSDADGCMMIRILSAPEGIEIDSETRFQLPHSSSLTVIGNIYENSDLMALFLMLGRIKKEKL